MIVCSECHKGGVTTRGMCYPCSFKNRRPKACVDCGTMRTGMAALGLRCKGCVPERNLFVEYGSGKLFAHSAVQTARAKGGLPPPTDYSCEDCGKQATDYDHRSYDAPLVLAPVCRGCNIRRKRAKPKMWTFDEFEAWFYKRYVHRETPLERMWGSSPEWRERRKAYFEKYQSEGAK